MPGKTVGIVLLVVGALLLYFGFQATDAPLEQARESLTGDYSDQTMIYLIGGAAAAIAGLALMLRRQR
jgi:hypothetical protein